MHADHFSWKRQRLSSKQGCCHNHWRQLKLLQFTTLQPKKFQFLNVEDNLIAMARSQASCLAHVYLLSWRKFRFYFLLLEGSKHYEKSIFDQLIWCTSSLNEQKIFLEGINNRDETRELPKLSLHLRFVQIVINYLQESLRNFMSDQIFL